MRCPSRKTKLYTEQAVERALEAHAEYRRRFGCETCEQREYQGYRCRSQRCDAMHTGHKPLGAGKKLRQRRAAEKLLAPYQADPGTLGAALAIEQRERLLALASGYWTQGY